MQFVLKLFKGPSGYSGGPGVPGPKVNFYNHGHFSGLKSCRTFIIFIWYAFVLYI